MAQLVGGTPYTRGQPPAVAAGAQKLLSWLGVEFSNVQRALMRDTTRSVTAAATATINDGTIVADATTAPFTVTLPAASAVPDATLTIVRTNGGGNAVTVGATVSGTVNPTLGSQYSSMTVRSCGSGTSWAWIKTASV